VKNLLYPNKILSKASTDENIHLFVNILPGIARAVKKLDV